MLQGYLHPEKFANKSKVCDGTYPYYHVHTQMEQTISSEQSSLVNKAYSTLVKPYTRALYLVCNVNVVE